MIEINPNDPNPTITFQVEVYSYVDFPATSKRQGDVIRLPDGRLVKPKLVFEEVSDPDAEVSLTRVGILDDSDFAQMGITMQPQMISIQ